VHLKSVCRPKFLTLALHPCSFFAVDELQCHLISPLVTTGHAAVPE